MEIEILIDIDRNLQMQKKKKTLASFCVPEHATSRQLPRQISVETVEAWRFLSNVRALEENTCFSQNGDFVNSAPVQEHKAKVSTEKTFLDHYGRHHDVELAPICYLFFTQRSALSLGFGKTFCGNTFFISRGMNEFMNEEKSYTSVKVFKVTIGKKPT